MKHTSLLLSFLLGLFVASCANDTTDEATTDNESVGTVRFTVQDFQWSDPGEAPSTSVGSSRLRTQAYKNNSGGISFLWSPSDTVGIFSTKGGQLEFPIGSGGGEASATFDGGCWALKKGYVYFAYLPYNRFNFDRTHIPFVYGAQAQVGNDNLDNFTKYDYIYSQAALPENGEITFKFQHYSSLVRFQLTVPEADQITAFSLIAPDEAFPTKVHVDLSGILPKFTIDERSRTFSMHLTDISVEAGGVVTLWALIPPTDLTGKTLRAMLFGDGGKIYTADLEGKQLTGNKAFGFAATTVKSETSHEWVDLGLPSGIKWASCNIGADKATDKGYYFSWGETTTEQKSSYEWSTYTLCNGSSNTLTRYNTSTTFGPVDGKTTLDEADDPASVHWGFPWRTPSKADFEELRSNCTWKWNSSRQGYTVTGKNGKSIFIPAAGYRNLNALNFLGSYGYYWTSTLNPESPSNAYCLMFQSSSLSLGSFNRYMGRPVRPVCD